MANHMISFLDNTSSPGESSLLSGVSILRFIRFYIIFKNIREINIIIYDNFFWTIIFIFL